MVSHIRLHGDGLLDIDTAIGAAIVILDRHIRLPLNELIPAEYDIVGNGFAGAIFVNRSDHHALRVELVAGHVLGLGRRCCDLDAFHLLDDLQHLKLVEHPHIASRWILKDAYLVPVYGHLIPCKPGGIAPCNSAEEYLDCILRIGLKSPGGQIIPTARSSIILFDFK